MPHRPDRARGHRPPTAPRSRCGAWSSASARSRPWTGSTSRSRRASASACSVPTAPGKSTTMRMLTAQTLADEGEIAVLGYELPRESKQARLEMGVVPQLDNLDVELTCRQILTVFARLYRVPRAERAEAVRARARHRQPRRARRHDRARALGRDAPAAARRARADPRARAWCCSTSPRWASTRRCARSCGR